MISGRLMLEGGEEEATVGRDPEQHAVLDCGDATVACLLAVGPV
jgi:hypothetical protein